MNGIVYETDWMAVLDGLALFSDEVSFIQALKDGKIKATGRFLDEIVPNQKMLRNEIKKEVWEEFVFNKETGELEGVYESPDVGNILQWYTDIEVSCADILALEKGAIGKNHQEAVSDKGGRPKVVDVERLYAELAAYIYNNGLPSSQERTDKAWRDAVLKVLPCCKEQPPLKTQDRTYRRYFAKFFGCFYSAMDDLDKTSA